MAQYHLSVGLENRNDVFLRTFFHINAQGIRETWYRCKKKNNYSHKKRFLSIPSQSSTPSRTCDAISFGMTGDGGPRMRSSPTRMVSSIVSCLSTVWEIVMRNWQHEAEAILKEHNWKVRTVIWYHSAKMCGIMIILIVSLLLLLALIYLLHNKQKGEPFIMYC